MKQHCAPQNWFTISHVFCLKHFWVQGTFPIYKAGFLLSSRPPFFETDKPHTGLLSPLATEHQTALKQGTWCCKNFKILRHIISYIAISKPTPSLLKNTVLRSLFLADCFTLEDKAFLIVTEYGCYIGAFMLL